ncbi:MAG: glycosyltransferase [Desulfobacterales bacterium]|nr:glycosyltransferase [Desulfobacterales bacterium]
MQEERRGETAFAAFLNKWIRYTQYSVNIEFQHQYSGGHRFMREGVAINVSGYITGEFGLGEAARSVIRSIDAAGIPYLLNNFDSNPHRKKDTTFTTFSRENPYPVNLILVNPDGLDAFLLEYGSTYFENKYNIAFWFWELGDFPVEWQKYMALFDEIWTGSLYSLDAIAYATDRPVLRVPLSIHLTPKAIHPMFLQDLKDKFVFLSVFDFRSTFQRKNPDKVIDAFLTSFENREDAMLVLKYTNSDANLTKKKMLDDRAGRHENIYIMDDYLHRDALVALFQRADCYVSLHAAEGFGLPIAEAMFLGKPVIATGYSANMEFMTVNNSFPVRFSLELVGETEGPYTKGNIWAKPDVAHCAELMAFVYENPSVARKIGKRARQDITALFSDQSIGARIKKRILRIDEITNHFRSIALENRQRARLIKAHAEIARLARDADILSRIFGRLLNTTIRWMRNIQKKL